MIVFDLACDCGLIFEGWFDDRADYQRQESGGLLVCPVCGGTGIHKILSPVRARSARGQAEGSTQVALSDSVGTGALGVLEGLQEFVKQNFEDVGARLAEESLKIRYGLAEERGLRGVVTPAEEKTLAREGIKLLKIPMPAKPGGDA